MLRCEDVRSELDAYLDGELEEIAAAAVTHHLESCSSCRAELERRRAVSAALRRLPPLRAPKGLVEKISAARAAAGRPRPRTAWNLRWAVGSAAAAAAGLLLAMQLHPLRREARARPAAERHPPHTAKAPAPHPLTRKAEEKEVRGDLADHYGTDDTRDALKKAWRGEAPRPGDVADLKEGAAAPASDASAALKAEAVDEGARVPAQQFTVPSADAPGNAVREEFGTVTPAPPSARNAPERSVSTAPEAPGAGVHAAVGMTQPGEAIPPPAIGGVGGAPAVEPDSAKPQIEANSAQQELRPVRMFALHGGTAADTELRLRRMTEKLGGTILEGRLEPHLTLEAESPKQDAGPGAVGEEDTAKETVLADSPQGVQTPSEVVVGGGVTRSTPTQAVKVVAIRLPADRVDAFALALADWDVEKDKGATAGAVAAPIPAPTPAAPPAEGMGSKKSRSLGRGAETLDYAEKDRDAEARRQRGPGATVLVLVEVFVEEPAADR